MWRENNGQSSSEAFHNLIRDLSVQAQAETGLPLVKRLPMVAADPFKDWNICSATQTTPTAESFPQPQPALPTSIPSAPTGGVKRPAVNVASGASNAKEAKVSTLSCYYGTMYVARKDSGDKDKLTEEITCQVSFLQLLIFNLE